MTKPLLHEPFIICSSRTRPANPRTGLIIWETNTASCWIFTVGGGWVKLWERPSG
jgi:hypothetical protein